MDHGVQGGGDEAGEADDVDLVLPRRCEDFVRRDHDAQVDDLVVVALEHDADDVFADVVHIALDGGEEYLAAVLHRATGLFRFQVGRQVGHGLFHDPGGFDYLGQEHLAGAEEVADLVHAVHQGALDDLERAFGLAPGLFGVLVDVFGDALDQGVLQAFRHRPGAPLEVFLGLGGTVALVAGGQLHEPLGGVRSAVEDDVFHRVPQLGGDVVEDGELTGVDDAHVEPRRDGVVEERGVDGLTHGVVAAEGEGDVGQAAGGEGVGQIALDPTHGLDEVQAVAVVVLDAGGDGEDVGVEDDVLGGKAAPVGEDAVGAGADLDPALKGVRLALLVEGHDDDGGAIASAQPGRFDELFFPFLEGDGVDHGLTLDALEPGLDDVPSGGVDHEGDPGDLRFRGHQVEEAPHGRLPVQHALVHVHVHQLGAVFDLGAADIQGLFELSSHNQALELGRAGDVGPFPHVDEIEGTVEVEGLQSGQPTDGIGPGRHPGRLARDGLGDGRDVLRGGAAAAPHDVEEAGVRPFGDLPGHLLRAQVVAAEFIGQAGVRVHADAAFGHP